MQLAPAALSLLLPACSAPDARPRLEDEARKVSPLPACVVDSSAVAVSPGMTRSLKDRDYWRMVFPGYDEKTTSLADDARSCNGAVSIPTLLESQPAGLRVPVGESDVKVGGGADRLKIVWLRMRDEKDGTWTGALALLRAFDSSTEVYAVGKLRANPDKTKLYLERIGPELVVVALDEECNGKVITACGNSMSVFAPREGALLRIGAFLTERIAYGSGTEGGISGRLEYHLTTSPAFIPGGVKLIESVKVTDELGREVRKAELERMYFYRPDDVMSPSDDPLWPRVYPEVTPPPPKAAK